MFKAIHVNALDSGPNRLDASHLKKEKEMKSTYVTRRARVSGLLFAVVVSALTSFAKARFPPAKPKPTRTRFNPFAVRLVRRSRRHRPVRRSRFRNSAPSMQPSSNSITASKPRARASRFQFPRSSTTTTSEVHLLLPLRLKPNLS